MSNIAAKSIDVLVVTAQRRESLEKCINSIEKSFGRIFVVVNGADRRTEEYLKEESKKNNLLKFSVLREKTEKSRARNMAIGLSEAEILYFIDDDAYCAGDNLSVISEKFEKYKDVSVIGGPSSTPADSSDFKRAAGYVLSSSFAAWGMAERFYRGQKETYCDDSMLTLCNLAVRKNVLEKEKVYFDERLEYNEENLMMQQLLKSGCKMVYCPDLEVWHERRANAAGFLRQVYASGKGRAKMTFIMPESLKIIYLMPSALVIYTASLLLFSSIFAFLPIIIYAAINIVNAIFVATGKKEKISCAVLVSILSPLSHYSYGAGFFEGCIEALFWQKEKH